MSSFDLPDPNRLSPQSRWTLEHMAIPVRLDDRDLDEVAADHGLSTRAAKRLLATLDSEARAHQVGAELPRHTKQELAALEEQLQRHGQIYPVVRIRVNGRVVEKDGATREALLEVLEIPVRYEDHDVETLEEARSLALGLNVARRQLTSKELREMAEAEILHDPKRSDRWIGELLGMSHHTVAKARRGLEKRGRVETVTTRVGKDGVAQPVGTAPTTPAAPRREEKLTAIAVELRELEKTEDHAAAQRRAGFLAVEVVRLFGAEAIADALERVMKRAG